MNIKQAASKTLQLPMRSFLPHRNIVRCINAICMCGCVFLWNYCFKHMLQGFILSVVLLWFMTYHEPPALKAVCSSCLSGAAMRLGKSVYTGHALLIHELLNFIVPSSSSCNLTLSVSTNSSLSLSLPLIQSYARLLSRLILLTFFNESAPVLQMHLCMDFNDLSGINVLAV